MSAAASDIAALSQRDGKRYRWLLLAGGTVGGIATWQLRDPPRQPSAGE